MFQLIFLQWHCYSQCWNLLAHLVPTASNPLSWCLVGYVPRQTVLGDYWPYQAWKRQLLCYTHQPFTIPSPVVSDTILFVGKQNKKYKYKDKIHIHTHQQITVATCIGLHTLLLVKDKYKYAYQSLTTHSYIVSQVALLLVQQ